MLPNLARLAPGAEVVALFKPQFELPRDAVGRGGVVRDSAATAAALDAFAAWVTGNRGAADCAARSRPGSAAPRATRSGCSTCACPGHRRDPRDRLPPASRRAARGPGPAWPGRGELGYDVWIEVREPEATLAEHAAATELLVTIGGDGTFLYGARLAAPRGIPVMGVNRGRLGFLTDVEVADLPGALEDFAAGRCHTQRRSMLEAIVPGDGDDGRPGRRWPSTRWP